MEKRLSACQGLHNFIKCTNEAERKGKEQTKQGVQHTGDFQGCSARRVLPSQGPCGIHSSSAVGQLLSDSPKGSISMSSFCPRTPESHHEQTITHPLMGRNGQPWMETRIFPNGNFSVVDGETLLCLFFLFFFPLV